MTSQRASDNHSPWLYLALMCLLLSVGCDEQILHNLSEREANKIVSNLSDANLSVDKVLQPDGRWAISVAEADKMVALHRLEAQRLLSSQDPVSASSSRSSIVPSREEERFRYERSVSQSVEESIKALPGVLDARVHVNLPDRDPLFGSREGGRGSGSVLLVVDDTFTSDDGDIAALVSGAAGISRDVVGILRSAPERIETPVVDSNVVAGLHRQSSAQRFLVWWPEAVGVSAIVLSALVATTFVRRRRPLPLFPLPKILDFEG